MPKTRRDLITALIEARQNLKNTQQQITELEAQLAADGSFTDMDVEAMPANSLARERPLKQSDFLVALVDATYESQGFDDAIETTLRLICQYTGWAYGEVWVPDVTQTMLICGRAHYIAPDSTDHVRALRQASEALTFRPKVGLIGNVWDSQQAKWIPDVWELTSTAFLRLDLCKAAHLHGVVGIPIEAQGQMVAVLCFMTQSVLEKEPSLVQLMSVAAARIGSILQRQKDTRELKRYAERMDLLHQIDRGLLQGDSIQDVIGITLKLVRKIIPCQRAHVAIIDPATQEGILFAIDANHDTVLGAGTRFPISPIAFEGLDERNLRVVDDIRTVQEHIPHLAHAFREGMISALQVSLMAHDKPMGALTLMADTAGFFTREYQDIAAEVADQLAIAINQLRLSNELSQRIADLERAHEVQRQSEARYRQVVEDQTEMICRYDADFRLTFVNRAYCDFYGKREQDLLGTNLLEYIPAEDRARAKANVMALNASSPIATSEHQSIMPDQTRRWFQWTDRALVDGDGKIVEYQGVGRDITDRKQRLTEQQQHMQAVEAMQKFLQSTFDAFPANAAVLAADGTIINVNAPWRRFAEENGAQPATHFLGANYLDVCDSVTGTDGDGTSSTAAGIRAVIAGEQDTFYQEYACHGTDQQRWFRLAVTPFDEPAARRVVVAHIDITGRKKAELEIQDARDTLERRVIERTAELQAEKGRVEAILDNSFEGILLVQHDLSIQRTNLAFARLFMYDTQMDTDLSLPALIDPDDVERVRTIMNTVIAEQINGQFETRARRRDGSMFEVEISVGHIKNNGLVCTLHDITERKKQERDLRYHASIQENVSEAVISTDLNFRIQSWNRAAERMYGWTAAEVVGKLASEVLQTVYESEEERERLKQTFLAQGYWTAEFTQHRKDGSLIYILGSINLLKDDQGQPLGVISVNHDTTELKQQERQLRYYASLVENVNDAVLSTDLDSHIQSWNRGAEAIYGWRADEVLGKLTPELLRPKLENGQRREDALESLVQQGRWHGEAIHHRKDGEEIPVIVSLSLLRDEHDQPAGVVGVHVDITERKRSERILQKKMQEELEFQVYLKNLHEITVELTLIDDIDLVYKRAVALGRERLGFERLALYLYDEAQQRAIGTYGTDLDGKITDEHEFHFTPALDSIELRSLHREERFAFDAEVPLYTTSDTVGMGWNAAAVLWNGSNGLGWLIIDNAISRNPATKAGLDILAIYALTLGTILAQKHVQSTLRESETRYRLLAENATDVVMRMTVQAQYTYVSPSSRAVVGYTPEELLGKNAIEYAHPDDLPTIRRALETATNPNFTVRLESRFKHEQGHYVWLESLVRPICSTTSGEVEEYIASSRDITERKHAEAALRDSEEKFRMLLQAAPVAVVLTDQNGEITLVNQQTEELFGYTQTELIGQYVELLIPEHLHSQHVKDREAYIDRPRVRRMVAGLDLYAKRKDRTEFPVEIELSFIKSNDTFTVMSFIVDITDRKQIAAELERQRAFLREVIDVSPSMIFVKDYDARFILVNPMVAKTYGTTVEALIGKSDADFNPKDEEITQFLEADRQVIASGEPMFIEEPITAADGTTRWFQTTKVPIISSDGASKYVLGISTDITERRKTEDALREAVQKEKELGELKTRFVSMASHEFRTPLATILALTETVITYRHKLNDAQIEQRLNKIQAQVWHLRDIVEDVLQLARIQARRVPFNPVMLNLDSLCRSVVDEFESRPKFAHQLVYRCEDVLQSVKLDRTLMRQVISNLVSNAIKYSPEGKTVTLDLGFQNNSLIFQVTDEGIGIPEADLKYLFEPFHRAANVGTIPGTGLGLVITKESIELHGGTINVHSEVNVGTTFIVSIPVEP